jgi:hypothetical protein
VNPQTKDEEVRSVVGELEDLLSELRANVAALNSILAPPPPTDAEGQEVPVP